MLPVFNRIVRVFAGISKFPSCSFRKCQKNVFLWKIISPCRNFGIRLHIASDAKVMQSNHTIEQFFSLIHIRKFQLFQHLCMLQIRKCLLHSCTYRLNFTTLRHLFRFWAIQRSEQGKKKIFFHRLLDTIFFLRNRHPHPQFRLEVGPGVC